MAVSDIASVAAVIATGFAAISAYWSRGATQAVKEDLELSRRTAKMELAQRFETGLMDLYEPLRRHFGSVDVDRDDLDPEVREVVYRLVVLHSLAFTANRDRTLPDESWEPLNREFIYWLTRDEASRVWRTAFAHQRDSWPNGYVDHVRSQLNG